MSVSARTVLSFVALVSVFTFYGAVFAESGKPGLSTEKQLYAGCSASSADVRLGDVPSGHVDSGLAQGPSEHVSRVGGGRGQAPDSEGLAVAEAEENEEAGAEQWDDSLDSGVPESISDPIEPVNRAFFHFNDRLYFWFLKPVSRGYSAVFPQSVRIAVRNFFYNASFPIRFVNCVFQGKFEGAGVELSRFLVNSTMGVAGFFDPATRNLGLGRQEEDLGQTLGVYHAGPGLFINWPFLGPSSVRDSIGLAGDAFLDPLNYIVDHTKYRLAVQGYMVVNYTSLTIGDYEALKRAALDPYVAVRDAYHQYRENKIKE